MDSLLSVTYILTCFHCSPVRLYGFKIHPMAYVIQQNASSNYKAPLRALNYGNGKRP